jgi:hypothetical protein
MVMEQDKARPLSQSRARDQSQPVTLQDKDVFLAPKEETGNCHLPLKLQSQHVITATQPLTWDKLPRGWTVQEGQNWGVKLDFRPPSRHLGDVL